METTSAAPLTLLGWRFALLAALLVAVTTVHLQELAAA